MRPIWPRVRAWKSILSPQSKSEFPNRLKVLVGLGRQPDHEVQLQILESGREDQLCGSENFVVCDRLVDDPSKTVTLLSGAIVTVH